MPHLKFNKIQFLLTEICDRHSLTRLNIYFRRLLILIHNLNLYKWQIVGSLYQHNFPKYDPGVNYFKICLDQA